MLTNIQKNALGTVSFRAKFRGMRQAQEFDVYPIGEGDSPAVLKIQSDTRIGAIRLNDGAIAITPSIQGGAYNHHLPLARWVDKLSAEELLLLKASVAATASQHAGGPVVSTDNAGAARALSIRSD